MTKTLILLGSAAFLLVAAAPPASAYDQDDLECIALSGGGTACGRADASICSGAAEGVATIPVDWNLRIVTTGPGSTANYYSLTTQNTYAEAGAAAICTTTTCTWAYLYANGQLVDGSDVGVC